jgi:hypothetical protein
MKRTLLIALFALAFVSCGGDDGAGPGNGGNDNPPEPVPTAAGVPDGFPITASIGAAGGSISSTDDDFTLEIPPGALASDTDITIQPITNTAWGGVGSGYRLTPDGLTFAVPVSLVFEIDAEDLVGTAPEFLDVAVQDDEGFWYVLKNRTYDDGAGTLTCTTTHFSDYSNIEGVQIRPASASVGTGGTVNLSVQHCYRETIPGDDNLAALVYTCDDDLAPLNVLSNWSVNGVTGGNTTVGRVVATGSHSARYTAPASIPQNNPVAVSVQTTFAGRSALLVSNITIGSTWYGTATAQWDNNEKVVATVVWTSAGTIQNIETFEPSGEIVYTPDTDYGEVCWFVSITPNTAPILSADGALIIDHSTDPPTFYGYGSTGLLATTCYTCEGWEEPDCQEYLQFPEWFNALQEDHWETGADGQTISKSWFDINSGTGYVVEFTRGSPPPAFARSNRPAPGASR